MPKKFLGRQANLNYSEKIYGRRKGRPLRSHRKELFERLQPALEISPAEVKIKATTEAPLWVEIGFGAGEHLLWQAKNNPDVEFIGSEVFVNGVAGLVSRISEDSIQNICLWSGDGRLLIDHLPDQTVEKFFILFPDPWPKSRHKKRRIISSSLLLGLGRVIKPNGILRIASDISDYQYEILSVVLSNGSFRWAARQPRDWRRRPPDWPETRYELKAKAAGRSCAYFSFERCALSQKQQSF